MKTVHLHLEEAQYKKLVEKKGGMSWVRFVMTLVDDE